MHIRYVPRERPPFSALNFRSRASPFYSFAVPATIIFKFSVRSSRSSPPKADLLQPARMGRTQSVRAAPPRLAAGQSASQTRPTVSSGDPHVHARARSGAPPPIFSLCRGIYLPKFGVSAPPPPGISISTIAYPMSASVQVVAFSL